MSALMCGDRGSAALCQGKGRTDMGWFEWLSDSDKPEGGRSPSVAEQFERDRYLAHNPPLKSEESFAWEGSLFTGYHLHKVKGSGGEYINWKD
ncbi:MAG: hypothetical protein ACRDRG_16125 [Pseudonocardiaceae bacterium]